MMGVMAIPTIITIAVISEIHFGRGQLTLLRLTVTNGTGLGIDRLFRPDKPGRSKMLLRDRVTLSTGELSVV